MNFISNDLLIHRLDIFLQVQLRIRSIHYFKKDDFTKNSSYIRNFAYLLDFKNKMISKYSSRYDLYYNQNQNVSERPLHLSRLKVLEYITHLVDYVKPKKGVFIAIDGVAPVAKIKQQRSRRFKSIHDKELYDKIRKKHNKPIPTFWNNSAITPGTVFMEKLHYKIIISC